MRVQCPESKPRALFILSFLLSLFHSFIQKTFTKDLICTRYWGKILSELNRQNPCSHKSLHSLTPCCHSRSTRSTNKILGQPRPSKQLGLYHCSKVLSFHLPPRCTVPSPLWPQQSEYSLHTPAGHYSHSWWHPVSGEWIFHHPKHRLHWFVMLPQQWALQSQCLTCQQPPEQRHI